MKINVKGAIWNVELPKAVKPGYYGTANFKCLTNDELSFNCVWEQPEDGKERQTARKCILNRMAE
jgi:hypothetical protein